MDSSSKNDLSGTLTAHPLEARAIVRAADFAHPLDHPIWSALNGRHRHLAVTEGMARRYPSDIEPFIAIEEYSPAGWAALARLTHPGEQLALVIAAELAPPHPFEVLFARPIDQMAGVRKPEGESACELVELGAADAAEMQELAGLTKPGPFAARTFELGRYLGVRAGGRLAAMAGERMRLEGFTEISAVCTHPEARGRGYAKALVLELARAIWERGERPFLHTLPENAPAVGLYKSMGFETRRRLQYSLLRRSE
jgi:predicted GNAT family acetyltransferase